MNISRFKNHHFLKNILNNLYLSINKIPIKFGNYKVVSIKVAWVGAKATPSHTRFHNVLMCDGVYYGPHYKCIERQVTLQV